MAKSRSEIPLPQTIRPKQSPVKIDNALKTALDCILASMQSVALHVLQEPPVIIDFLFKKSLGHLKYFKGFSLCVR